MRPILMSLALVALMHSPAPAQAGLGEAAELEAARANARAGGPISERDRELLDRYGCLSGTRNQFCIDRERHYSWSGDRPRRERRHRHD